MERGEESEEKGGERGKVEPWMSYSTIHGHNRLILYASHKASAGNGLDR